MFYGTSKAVDEYDGAPERMWTLGINTLDAVHEKRIYFCIAELHRFRLTTIALSIMVVVLVSFPSPFQFTYSTEIINIVYMYHFLCFVISRELVSYVCIWYSIRATCI